MENLGRKEFVKVKTILITGITGFLGSYLAYRFLDRGYKVVGLKRSFSNIWRISDISGEIVLYDIDKADLTLIFKENKVDFVLHTATSYGRKKESISSIVEANLLFPLKLLELSIFFDVKVFFNTDTMLNKFVSPYSISKKQFLEWLSYFSKSVKVVNLRLEHIYGPKDDDNKFVIWLISQLFGEANEINLTEGKQMRDFIYIEDVIDAYEIVVSNESFFKESFNEIDIGSGNLLTIKDFVLTVYETVKKYKYIEKKMNFGAVPYRENEFIDIEKNLTPIYSLGWKPKTTIKEGLQKTIEWWMEHNHVT
ncbi:MAG: NAD(P)-dependent oxidoreductase [Hydrogenothermaceae bacterium]|nr:NAD(P)-dependent oxidoreductase [Hydrogenothermaceae bacterium]